MNDTLTIIKSRDLRNDMQKVADAVAKGKSFLVMKQSKPLFKISKPDVDEWGDRGNWETVVDFEKDSITVDEFMAKLQKIQNERQNN
jgi:hypothetical protein